MTASLAIAATSEVLRYIVLDALVRAEQLLGVATPKVTLGPPPRPPVNGPGNGVAEAPSINLFLHHVTPNPAWRNMHSPERDCHGRRLNNAPLVLDLHYLLSANGADMEREIFLGAALHALHQAGIVPAVLIRAALTGLGGLQNPQNAIARADLADQIERLTVTHQALDIDAITKIWTATQVPYRPSAGYLVTTVFLEEERPSHQALPVGAAGLTIAPMSSIAIASVTGLKAGLRAPIAPGAQLQVTGHGFGAPDMTATIDEQPAEIDISNSTLTKLVLNLPTDLTVGAHFVDVARAVQVGGHATRMAGAGKAFTLRPAIGAITATVTPDTTDPTLRNGKIKVQLTPSARRDQAATLRLMNLTAGDSVTARWVPPPPTVPAVDEFAQIEFAIKGARSGGYVATVEIGRVSSQPEQAANGELGPRVTL